MSKKVAIVISPNYKDYAKKYLSECFISIKQQDYNGGIKIFITDNESTAESFDLIKKLAPEAEIIRNKDNDGFAKGNNDAIKKALEQGFNYIALFNMDTVLEPDCLRKMVEAAESEKQIGAIQARLMLYENKNKINSLGNVTHFLGFGYADKYNQTIINQELQIKDICYPSGAAVLFKREVLEKVGLFDEEFWMYNEDQDIGWRIWLAGFKCVLAPEAAVYHKYEFSRSIKKYYWMDRNRIIAILKNYHLATLILIFPAFLVMEIGLIFFAVSGGWFKEKINVYKYFLSLKNWRYIIKARRQTQKLRLIQDRDIIKMFSGKIWYQEIGNVKLKVANAIFNVYWKIIKIFIRW
jgi:GT2 family glycosyltransferase